MLDKVLENLLVRFGDESTQNLLKNIEVLIPENLPGTEDELGGLWHKSNFLFSPNVWPR